MKLPNQDGIVMERIPNIVLSCVANKYGNYHKEQDEKSLCKKTICYIGFKSKSYRSILLNLFRGSDQSYNDAFPTCNGEHCTQISE